MNSQQFYPVILNLIAAFIGAFGQYAYKQGALKLNKSMSFLNIEIVVGAALFVGVMVLFVVAFKLGGQISVTYPVYATTFIWGTILGILMDGETLNSPQYLGIGLVVAGIYFIARYSVGDA